MLENVQPSHFTFYHPSVVAIYLHYRFAIYLASHSAFIPELIELKKDKYQIRWLPALLVGEVKAIFEMLVQLSAPQLIQLTAAKGNKQGLSGQQQSKLLLAAFLNFFQQNNFITSNLYFSNYDALESLFFLQTSFYSDGFQTKKTPQAIQKWLQKFYLAEKEYTPLLKIEAT